MKRKGQIQGQIVIYVLSAFVVIMILLYGYKAIQDFSNKADTISYIQFKKEFDSTIQRIAGDPGSELTEEFRLPGRDDEVCFAETESDGGMRVVWDHNGNSGDRSIVYRSLFDGEGVNVFLFKKDELSNAPFTVNNLLFDSASISGDIACFHADSYRVKIKFTGTGSGTEISAP